MTTKKPSNNLVVDKNGFKESDAGKLKDFLDDLNSNSDLVPREFFNFTVSTRQLKGDPSKQEDLAIKITKIASIYLFGEIVEELGTLEREPNTRVVGRFPNYRLECQSKETVLLGVFSHPSVEDIRDDVRQCAVAAAIAAGIAALITGAAGAFQTFKTTFQGCLINKGYAWADQISVDIRTEDKIGTWRRC